MTPLTDTTFPGYFQASFSPKAGYYVLGYKGPEVPWQRLIETGPGEDREFFFFFFFPSPNSSPGRERTLKSTVFFTVFTGANVLLEGNAELNKTISEFLKPLVTRTTIENDGYGKCTFLLLLPSSNPLTN